MDKKIYIGVSACLLGRKVRYDGGHKLDRIITDIFGPYFDYLPVCPEVECGFPIPREAFRLVGNPNEPRLITVRSHMDVTERMSAWARNKVIELEKENLYGFIFKSDSPSSGMERVKVYSETGIPSRKGSGVFARIFMNHFPRLPVEEEGRLHDAAIRENFVERIFTLQRWRDHVLSNKKPSALIAFHTAHKLILLSHSPSHYRTLGRLVAKLRDVPLSHAIQEYENNLMDALQIKATTPKHVNVLQHMLGYFRKILPSEEKQEILDIIRNYHAGVVPLIVPITLFNHLIRKYGIEYLSGQTYLQPHPLELKLRNHV